VSGRATNLVGLVASMSIICSIFTPYGFPWSVLAWTSLGLAAGGLLVLRSSASIRQVIHEVEAVPALAVGPPLSRPRGRTRGDLY
jgi:hypothetical protein